MPRTWDLASVAAWRGKDVWSKDGHRLGRLQKIIYDYESNRPAWLGIADDVLGICTYPVPVQGTEAGNDRLIVSYSDDAVKAQPEADVGMSFDSRTEAQGIHEYFGIPFDDWRDLRALWVGDEFPGVEQVIGPRERGP